MTSAWSTWVGVARESEDVAAEAPLRMLRAALGGPDAGPKDAVAPLRHWLYFLEAEDRSRLGEDGHPRRGGFLPSIELPRRMWAGSRVEFVRPIRVGETLRRVSRIDGIESKHGATGALVFVRVAHEVFSGEGTALREMQNIVYRAAPVPGAPVRVLRAPAEPQFSRQFEPDPVLLFRYSALTFNGHRIHYDQPYAREVEGYPGLVVHGPLVATLLIDTFRAALPGGEIAGFEFKALGPLFVGAPMTLAGRLDGDTGTLWALDADGRLAMQASARLRA